MESVKRFDRTLISKAEITNEGFLKAQAIVTRTGVFDYINPDGTLRRELRHPQDVFQADSLNTIKMKPITNDHPKDKVVTSENAGYLQIGYTGETVNHDEKYVSSSLIITDAYAVSEIKEKRKTELSLGYVADLIPEVGTYDGKEYQYRQTNIRYNHLALVDMARAGAEAKIHMDANDAIAVLCYDGEQGCIVKKDEREIIKMTDSMESVNLDGITYKGAPELVNAYKKAVAKCDEASAKYDALNIQVEKLKAEKDALTQRLDTAEKVDIDSKVFEAANKRIALIENVKAIMGDKSKEIKLDSMKDADLIKHVIKEKCSKVNVDSASEVYLQARFDMLCEEIQKKETQESDNFGKQREQVVTKHDSVNKVMEAYKRMTEDTLNAWKPRTGAN